MAAAATEQGQCSPLVLALTSSMNQIVETAAERDAANVDRVPSGVLALLLLSTVGACLLVGFMGGQEDAAPPLIPWIIFVTLMLLVVATIVDLDRPTHGLIRIGQEPIVRLMLEEVR
jgi:hypothetical protein